jgi:hypothetical protein
MRIDETLCLLDVLRKAAPMPSCLIFRGKTTLSYLSAEVLDLLKK